MSRHEVIKELKEYFNIYELVDEQVYSIYGERAWRFFQTDLLHVLLIFRKELGKSITVNDWHWGGRFSQRGLRHNQSPMVKNKKNIYLSAHMRGVAVDFNVSDVQPNDVRQWAVDNPHLFPCKIRLENKLRGSFINWVHVDTDNEEKNPRVYLFNV